MVMTLMNVPKVPVLSAGRLLFSKGSNLVLNQDHILDNPKMSGHVLLMLLELAIMISCLYTQTRTSRFIVKKDL
jgi:hypothetical protein